MTFQLIDIFYCLALGCVSGFFAGLLGIGGGLLLVPVYHTLFVHFGLPTDIAFTMSLATSTATILPTSIASTIAHARQGGVQWKLVWAMSSALVGGALLTSYFVPEFKASWLAALFAVFVSVVAVSMCCRDAEAANESSLPKLRWLWLISVGVGGISALVAIGGGVMIVPLLSHFGLQVRKAIATSAACGVPISAAATLGYCVHQSPIPDSPWLVGSVLWPAALCTGTGALLTVSFGARCSRRWPTFWLRRLFAVLLIALAIKTVIATFT